VFDLAERIRRYRTSRLAQRRVYDQTFAPEVVEEAWARYFEHGEIAAKGESMATESSMVVQER